MTTIALPTTVTALPLRKPARGEGDTAPSARVACGLRRRLWRVAVAVTGGMTVTGRWRVSGGCVVVANHSSHADTAVLLAALPATARPVFAAAADYWFDVPVRRFVAGSLAGVLPVSRRGGGAYAGLLAAARPALRAGRCVVIYPEGTRSPDGRLYRGKTGVARLALVSGAPVVPGSACPSSASWPGPTAGRLTSGLARAAAWRRGSPRRNPLRAGRTASRRSARSCWPSARPRRSAAPARPSR